MEYFITHSRRQAPETQIDDKKRPHMSGDPPSEKQSTSTPGLIFLSFYCILFYLQLPCVFQSSSFLVVPRVTTK